MPKTPPAHLHRSIYFTIITTLERVEKQVTKKEEENNKATEGRTLNLVALQGQVSGDGTEAFE